MVSRLAPDANNPQAPAHEKNILAFGEVLWDRLPNAMILGGAPMNFAYRAASLGDRAAIISRLGDDDLGREASALLSELGVDRSLVQMDAVHPTGVVDIEFDDDMAAHIHVRPNAAFDNIEPLAGALRYSQTGFASFCPLMHHYLKPFCEDNRAV